MNRCRSCDRSDVPVTFRFCPYCGDVLTDTDGSSDDNIAANLGDLARSVASSLPKSELGNLALNVATTFGQHWLRKQLGPVGEVLANAPVDRILAELGPVGEQLHAGGLGAPREPVPSVPAPDWYLIAVQEGQPRADATQVALDQAKAISNARIATQNVRAAMDSAKARMDAIMSNIGRTS